MKSNFLVNALFCVVISCTTLRSEGIVHENKKQTSRELCRIDTAKPKPGSIKGNKGDDFLSRTSRKPSSAVSVLR